MGRKLGLPVHPPGRIVPGHPTLERARQTLGGRGATDALAGEIVRVDGSELRGVVVFADERECDVFLEAGFVKRTARERVARASAEVESPLHELSGEAKVFGGLSEGGRVRFDQPGAGTEEGLLFEKCRYGALVAKDDGTIVAVGFRKLFPAQAPMG